MQDQGRVQHPGSVQWTEQTSGVGILAKRIASSSQIWRFSSVVRKSEASGGGPAEAADEGREAAQETQESLEVAGGRGGLSEELLAFLRQVGERRRKDILGVARARGCQTSLWRC